MMANRVNQAPLVIRDENFVKPAIDAKAKGAKTALKKGGAGGSIVRRKALKDITNKSSVKSEISLRKNIQVQCKEEFNIADEGFLHDHKKCIKEREAALNHFDLNLVLPGHDSTLAKDKQLKSKEAKLKVDFDSFRCYPDPVELLVPSLVDFAKESTSPTSPLGSPLKHDASVIHDNDFFWEFAEVELTLKQEIDA
ncbi:hypothetical protein MLD38_026870 [Melastoma candidum]|uniref:Uncharacterized protein n=1 Tax=Melastoma candidum TaxID=119954 RepID=A0ACB9P1U0_9MYRT|nr:hypothetical protein MLD38_026870 [Melastoma candidum]